MSPVEFKKRPCHPVGFEDQRPQSDKGMTVPRYSRGRVNPDSMDLYDLYHFCLYIFRITK